MCEFCKNVKTGDDFNPILDKDFNCGILGKINVCIDLSYEHEMRIGIFTISKSGYDSTEVGYTKKKIKYCPMCGERL